MHQRVLAERAAAARGRMADSCARIGRALGMETPNLDNTERDPQVQAMLRDEAVASFLSNLAEKLDQTILAEKTDGPDEPPAEQAASKRRGNK